MTQTPDLFIDSPSALQLIAYLGYLFRIFKNGSGNQGTKAIPRNRMFCFPQSPNTSSIDLGFVYSSKHTPISTRPPPNSVPSTSQSEMDTSREL